MKNLYKAGCLAILLFTAIDHYAQSAPPVSQENYSRPYLFASLPEKSECSLAQLENLFSYNLPGKVGFRLGSSLWLTAEVMENVRKNPQQQTINLRLEEYSNALFTISRIDKEGSFSYTGRIVSPTHNDIMFLVREGERYFLIRKERKFTMVE